MDWQRLEAYVFEKMSKTKLPGLSMAIVKDGEVVYARGFGFRDLESGAPMTPQTRVGIGSVTKSFTALSIMMLVEEGKIGLDDPVDKFVPISLRPFGEPVRVWHLLTHSSGIPALAYAEAFIRYVVGEEATWIPIASFDDLKAFMSDAENWAAAKPGERFFYLNEGYLLLGRIIEVASGKSYEEFVKERVLKPLSMSRTTFRQEEVASDPDWATPYVIDLEGKRIPSKFPFGISADGGLISTVVDLCNYLRLYLDRGKWNGEQLVSPESLEQMETPKIPLASPLFGNEGYGFGWSVYPDFLGHKLVAHSGSVLVHTAFAGYIPNAKIGVAVLANASGHPLSQIGMVALAIMLGKEPELLPFVRHDKLLEKLIGRYETYKGTMKLQVSRKGDALILETKGRLLGSSIPFLPEELENNYARFYTIQHSRKVTAEFFIEGDKVTLLYERYKLVKVGV
ncbi:MAG: serine hydrolase [Armatimonadota bacterium]|nr:serine hydrolase [Armatimonadota bacterium]MDW8143923.1 serine hydrolase [Armatimonadota bacterium]